MLVYMYKCVCKNDRSVYICINVHLKWTVYTKMYIMYIILCLAVLHTCHYTLFNISNNHQMYLP